jgi:glutamate-1-semialdehyde 2,1-aminomutase
LPDEDFLSFLREITIKYDSLFIFDEVITGFRLALGGAQERFDIKPDLTTAGKIVGGGFPAAAFGGRDDIMALLTPDGPVYQAGTLSGNPIAMTAGIETLKILMAGGFYENLEEKADLFIKQLKEIVIAKGIKVNHIGSMFTLFFTTGEVRNFEDVKKCDSERFARFFRYMLANNIYISPSQFEANFISSAHSDNELKYFLDVVSKFE